MMEQWERKKIKNEMLKKKKNGVNNPAHRTGFSGVILIKINEESKFWVL